jgi:ribonuclease HII
MAAAVILPPNFSAPGLNDSKQLTAAQRQILAEQIKNEALAYAIAACTNHEIDQINILNASILAMHRAVDQLHLKPELLVIDGNRFKPYLGIPHVCMVKGDARFLHIAAASVLAKTARDAHMEALSLQHPEYGWEHNMGYPTKKHRAAIADFGPTSHHRMTFKLLADG